MCTNVRLPVCECVYVCARARVYMCVYALARLNVLVCTCVYGAREGAFQNKE